MWKSRYDDIAKLVNAQRPGIWTPEKQWARMRALEIAVGELLGEVKPVDDPVPVPVYVQVAMFEPIEKITHEVRADADDNGLVSGESGGLAERNQSARA